MARHRSRGQTAAALVVVLVVGVVGVVTASAVVGGRSARLPAPVHPKLPDLVMGPIEDVFGGLAEITHAPVVRVEATVVNRGAGDFLLEARRDFPWSGRWTVYQRTVEADGSLSEQATPADLILIGAPHSHWHVRDMESHRLERLDTGEVLSEVIKQGFCPFDTDLYHGDLPGAPANPVYLESGCEGPAWGQVPLPWV